MNIIVASDLSLNVNVLVINLLKRRGQYLLIALSLKKGCIFYTPVHLLFYLSGVYSLTRLKFSV